MTDKDPKDMTVSEQLRWAANGEPYNGIDKNIWTYPTGKIRALAEAVTGEWPSDNEIFSIVADKIDAELAQARELSLLRGAELWAKANGWPDFRDGEDFGAWLYRCFIPRPRFEDGEPVQVSDMEEIGAFATYRVNMDGSWEFEPDKYEDERRPKPWDVQFGARSDRVKRPAPEVLGADGKPIKVGETVYPIDGEWIGIPLEVSGIESPASVKVYLSAGKSWTTFHADGLTHTLPDTQERIDEDALKSCVQYWGCNDLSCGKCPALIDGKKPVEFYELDPIHDSCHEAQRLDLLRRQRELDKRTGGAE